MGFLQGGSKSGHRNALLLATSSSIATIFTHPLDVVRVQMQARLSYTSPSQVLKQIVKYRGFWGIYFGLITSLEREFIYCLLRFSLYEGARSRGLVDNFWRKLQYASASGFLGGLISTPLSKISVRIRTDAANPPHLRYNYAHVFHGLKMLYYEGGFKSLYNMVRTCAIRGMLITVCQLTIYNHVKEELQQQDMKFQSDWQCYLLASAIAGGITMIALTPIDLVEHMGHNIHARNFSGEWKIVRRINYFCSWKGFYRGLATNVFRIPPHTIFTFLLYEHINSIILEKFG